MTRPVLLLDSITDAGPDAAGAVAICGSHGGLYAASLASQAGLHGVILNDAGIGLNGAGIAGCGHWPIAAWPPVPSTA
ncbi:MAG: hypothetical protein JKP98_00180 [Rhodobacteraceae bacterium]|nr:hypothetical protein [Paracoccaceae bacterium]